MSNIIDNILLGESATVTSNATSVVEQVSKDKPSLFDSILSNISTAEEVGQVDDSNSSLKTQIQTTNIKDVKVENSNLLNNNINLLENLESTESLDSVKIDTQIIENKEKVISTGSLLDKLVLEAKKNVVEQVSKDKPSLFDSILSNISTVEEVGQVDEAIPVKIEIKDSTVANSKIVSDVSIKNNQIVDSSNNDLVQVPKDNSVLESAKSIEKDLKTVTQNILDNNSKLDSQNIQLITPTQNQEVITKEVVLDSEVLALNKNTIHKEEITAQSTPLIDKLVIDTKENIKDVENNPTKSLNKLISTEKLVLDKNTLENNTIAFDVKNVLIEETETKDLKNLNNTLGDKNNSDVFIDKSVNSALIEDKKASSETVILPKDQIEKISTNLDNKNINILTPILNTTNITSEEKRINETNNLVNLKSDSEVLDITNTSTITLNNDIVVTDEVKIENPIENKLEVVPIKKDEKLSLMDQLIQKNSEKLTIADTINNDIVNSSTKEIITKDLISNIYLGSQKNKVNNQTLFNKNEAIAILKDGNSLQAVKVSAEILDLGLEDIALDKSIDTDKLDLKQLNKKDSLDHLLLQKNVKSEEVRNLITKSVEASKALIEDTITLSSDTTVNVNSPIAYNIQSKIIGAKQQMATMMSDIARQMYENYKPPVTAFKINLNPTELGSIAILMKSDKNSGLSITMNVSNNVTLDTLIENQNVLKNSLNKTFDENTKFNLDFGSSNQNSNNQSSNNQNNSNNRQFEQQMGTQAVLQLKEENKEIEEKVIDYM